MNRLSKELAAAVAKSDRENGNDWLPFWMHSFDTAGIMEKLAQKRLPESISDYLCAECGGREKLFSTLKFCALVHDIGKLTIVFQSRIYDAVDFSPFADCVELPKSGSLVNASDTPHALASEAILLKLGCREGVASIAGAHHGRPSAWADVRDQISGACTAVENFYGKGGNTGSYLNRFGRNGSIFRLNVPAFPN